LKKDSVFSSGLSTAYSQNLSSRWSRGLFYTVFTSTAVVLYYSYVVYSKWTHGSDLLLCRAVQFKFLLRDLLTPQKFLSCAGREAPLICPPNSNHRRGSERLVLGSRPSRQLPRSVRSRPPPPRFSPPRHIPNGPITLSLNPSPLSPPLLS
jgi:hypothetical protein